MKHKRMFTRGYQRVHNASRLTAPLGLPTGLGNDFYALEAEVHNEMVESIRFIVDLRRFCFRAAQAGLGCCHVGVRTGSYVSVPQVLPL